MRHQGESEQYCHRTSRGDWVAETGCPLERACPTLCAGLPGLPKRPPTHVTSIHMTVKKHYAFRLQLCCKCPIQNVRSLLSLTREVEVRPGIQEVVFPLSDQIRWLENSSLEWIRVDFGTLYPAKIRIHELTLE